MAKRIIWTSRAEKIFTEILLFYFKRNGTKTYSRKLNNEIEALIKLLGKHPYLGEKDRDRKDVCSDKRRYEDLLPR
jgi:plasmid stabilization system protein ParE